jgi:non-specific protein-tyrosine kinase
LLVAGAVITGAAAFLVSSSLPKVYEGRVTLLVGQSVQETNPDINQLLASQRLSQTYAELAMADPQLQAVITKVGVAVSANEFAKRVRAEAPRDSILVHLTVEDGDPVRAAALANALAERLIELSPAISGVDSDVQRFVDDDLASTQTLIRDTQDEIQRLTNLPSRSADEERRLETLQARIVTLRQTYSTLLGFASGRGANLLTVVDPATPPSEPAGPRVLLATLIAAAVGFLVALGLVYLLDYLDDSLRTSVDVEAVLELPTLGTITRMRGGNERSEMYRLATLLYPRSPAAEAYRSLRTNTEFASVDSPTKTVLVTSSVPGEGKTTTATNLAVAMAQAGQKTVLLDADFRKPGVHKVFSLPNTAGLSTLLRRDHIPAVQTAHETEQDDLLVITTGPLPPNPAELLRSKRMAAVLKELSAMADFVVIDSPPVQAVTDAVILSSIADGTLLVIDAGRTHRGNALAAQEALAKTGGRLLGVVLNRTESHGPYSYDSYGAQDGDEVPRGQLKSSTSGSPPAG